MSALAAGRMGQLQILRVGPSLVEVRSLDGSLHSIGWRTLRAAACQDDAFLRAAYADLLSRAERKLLTKMRDEANRRFSACHGHRVAASVERAYAGAVSRDENRAAHGGVCLRETCGCGAERWRNRNGSHEEVGSWYPARVDLVDVHAAIREGGAS